MPVAYTNSSLLPWFQGVEESHISAQNPSHIRDPLVVPFPTDQHVSGSVLACCEGFWTGSNAERGIYTRACPHKHTHKNVYRFMCIKMAQPKWFQTTQACRHVSCEKLDA